MASLMGGRGWAAVAADTALRPGRGDVRERVPGTRASASPVPRPAPGAGSGRHARQGPWRGQAAGVLCLMVALSGLLLARVWRAPLSSTLGGGGGDAGLFLWFLRWTPAALAAGHAPWYSDLLNAPGGVNALWNTSLL